MIFAVLYSRYRSAALALIVMGNVPLALIGAVVAEFVAGSGGNASGLAYRILEASYQLKIPRMFAALLLISASGVAIFLVTSYIAHLLLRRWHESAVKREN